VYQRSAKVAFLPGDAHAALLSMLAGLSERNASYFQHELHNRPWKRECVLTATVPRVWTDIVLSLRPLLESSTLQLLSPENLVGEA
jgi:hypothetical protein